MYFRKFIPVEIIVVALVFLIGGWIYFKFPKQSASPTAAVTKNLISQPSERYGNRIPFYKKDGISIEYYWPSDQIAPGISSEETEMLVYNESSAPIEITKIGFSFMNSGAQSSIYSGTWEKFSSRQSWNRTEYINIGKEEYTQKTLTLQPKEKGKIHYHLTHKNAFSAKNQSALVSLTLKKSKTTDEINQTLVRKEATATRASSSQEHSSNKNKPSSTLVKDQNMPPCGEKTEFFTVSPLLSGDFHGIVPIGTLSPTGHVFPSPHLYFHVRRSDPEDFDSIPVEVPAVSPGNIRVTKISLIEAINRPDFTDSYLEFSACKEMRGYFDHVKKLSPKLQKAYDAAKATTCNKFSQSYQAFGTIQMRKCDKPVSVDLKTGEALGTAGGSKGQMVFDFGAIDYRNKPHTFANSSRWYHRPEILYITCALDYFSSPLKETLKSQLGQSDGETKRIIEPICGTVAQDKPGTAQGIWVVKGTDVIGHEGPHISLVHDNIDPRVGVFSVGTSMENGELKFGKYTFIPKHSGFVDREFGEIIESKEIFCFEPYDDWYPKRRISNTILLLQLISKTKLRIEKQSVPSCGSGPWSFDKSAVEFER